MCSGNLPAPFSEDTVRKVAEVVLGWGCFVRNMQASQLWTGIIF